MASSASLRGFSRDLASIQQFRPPSLITTSKGTRGRGASPSFVRWERRSGARARDQHLIRERDGGRAEGRDPPSFEGVRISPTSTAAAGEGETSLSRYDMISLLPPPPDLSADSRRGLLYSTVPKARAFAFPNLSEAVCQASEPNSCLITGPFQSGTHPSRPLFHLPARDRPSSIQPEHRPSLVGAPPPGSAVVIPATRQLATGYEVGEEDVPLRERKSTSSTLLNAQADRLKQSLCSPICILGFPMGGSRRRCHLHGHEMSLLFAALLRCAACEWLLCHSRIRSLCKLVPLWLALRFVPLFEKLSPQWGSCCSKFAFGTFT